MTSMVKNSPAPTSRCSSFKATTDLPAAENTPHSSFTPSFALLSREKRAALHALYTFCGKVDALADAAKPAAWRRKQISDLQKRFRAAFFRKEKNQKLDSYLQETLAVAWKYDIPWRYFQSLFRGMLQDTRKVLFHDFSELHAYTLRAAGAPGCMAMVVFGGRTAAHFTFAEHLGTFLQLTNMVRDFKEDLARGRLYFPLEDWKHFGIKPFPLQENHPNLFSFLLFQLHRAEHFRKKAFAVLSRRDRAKLPAALAMADAYEKLWWKLAEDPLRVLEAPPRLQRREIFFSCAKAFFQSLGRFF